MQEYYSMNDPKPVKPDPSLPRLWPWVLVGLLCAGTIAYYVDGVWERLMAP